MNSLFTYSWMRLACQLLHKSQQPQAPRWHPPKHLMPAGGAPSHCARSRTLGMVADTATYRTLLMGCPRISRSLRGSTASRHAAAAQKSYVAQCAPVPPRLPTC